MSALNPSDPSVALPAPPCTVNPPADDEHWFRESVQPHEGALRGYLRRKYPTLDTDDVVQESYLKLFRMRSVRQIVFAKAFLFTVASNTANTLFRRRKLYSDVPVSELPDSQVLEDTASDAFELINTRQQQALLVEVVAELPVRCREIFMLRLARGLTNAEIAQQLGLSEGTVRTQVVRAMHRCTEMLKERGVNLE